MGISLWSTCPFVETRYRQNTRFNFVPSNVLVGIWVIQNWGTNYSNFKVLASAEIFPAAHHNYIQFTSFGLSPIPTKIPSKNALKLTFYPCLIRLCQTAQNPLPKFCFFFFTKTKLYFVPTDFQVNDCTVLIGDSNIHLLYLIIHMLCFLPSSTAGFAPCAQLSDIAPAINL